jgi:glycosyltransferase involved in cell wall biosynthesis
VNPTSSSPARVLLAIDNPGWAFHNIAQQVKHHLEVTYAEPVVCDIALADGTHNADADLAVVLPWRSTTAVIANNRCHRAIVCIYDKVTWLVPQMEHALRHAIQQADAIAAANQEIADELRYRKLATKPVFIVEDGVDREMFTPQPMPQTFAVGWVGNSAAGHSAIKGLELIEAACKQVGAELRVADLANGKPIAHHNMSSFYAGVSTVICASTAEGTPNPPLEAMACGRPVITTRVGIMPRTVVDGVNGYFVKRSVSEIADAILKIKGGDIGKMGSAARDAVEPHAWGVKVLAWRSMVRSVLGVKL